MIPTNSRAKLELKSQLPAKAGVIALFHFSKTAPAGLDQLTDSDRAAADSLVKNKMTSTKRNGVTKHFISNPQPHVLMLVCLGEKSDATSQSHREAAAAVAKHARKNKIANVAIILPDDSAVSIESMVSGYLLGDFHFTEYKGSFSKRDEKDKKPVTQVTFIAATTKPAQDAFKRGLALGEGQNLSRTIASRPGNIINPVTLAQVARDIAKSAGLTCKILDEKQLKKLGMGGLLAVGAGSPNPPRLIALEHRPASEKNKSPLLVIGKSITFDTGGVSIKPADKMGGMIYDKCGGMAVLGLMHILAKLKVPLNVIGLLSSAENHVSGDSYRPGDIITQYNGVTVEVTNTDAEGRLVLADAIAWGIETYKPAAVVDLATLTGGCVVALGMTMAGLMSNDDKLVAQLEQAANRAGEKLWRLPVGEDQRDMIKSHHADIVNSCGRWASPLTGAAFLTYALPKNHVPWAHLDIAGVADTEKELPLYEIGATGYGVRTLYQWITGHLAT